MLRSFFGTPEPSFRLADELKSPQYQHFVTQGVRERRSLVSIGVIDDEPFQPKHNLENVGYKIVLLGDPKNIEAAKPHQIVLCDIQGVGQALDAKRQGSFLIRELKMNYPDKYVVAYSGGAMTHSLVRDSAVSADAFLKKDVDIETWTDKLDDVIKTLLDPYQVWMRQRRALIERDVDTLTIIRLEDAFVKSMTSRAKPDETPLAAFANTSLVRTDVRAIMQSLIASGIFKILVG